MKCLTLGFRQGRYIVLNLIKLDAMPELVLLSPQNRFVKDILKLKIQPEPWMHLGIIEWDNGNRGYALWIWDSRQVIEEGYLSEKQNDRIGLYITDHFLTNEIKTIDNFLPLSGGGNISKAISEYFDRQYDNLITGIEAYLNLSYEEAIYKLSDKSNKSKLVTRIKEVLRTISTYGQRCINIDNFKDGIKIRCNGGHDVAAMVNNKLIKAGLKTNLPNNSRFIMVYFK